MPDFIAVKRLAGTDLGWFRSLYHTYSNSNLKGININADVLIGEFYRDLPVITAPKDNRLLLPVTMFGPAQAKAYERPYKLVKSPGSKNWRLNGTLVDDPIGEERRFDILRPDDLAVIAFDGRPVPTQITLILLSAEDAGDSPLYRVLSPMIGGGRVTMTSIGQDEISAALDAPGAPPDHPLSLLLDDEDMAAALEDAVQGGIRGIRRIRRGRGRRRATAEDVQRAQHEMARVGAEGEALVDGYLTLQRDATGGPDYEWTSKEDSYAPYDFTYKPDDGNELFIDVKTTKGGPDVGFHISLGEVICAAESQGQYQIYRVHALTDEGATLRISLDIREFAKRLLAAHNASMPKGVSADSFSVPIEAEGIGWEEEEIDLFPADGL